MERLAQAIWDPWLLGLFLLVGTIYSFGSGFFQFFQAKVWLRATVGSLFSRPSGKHRSGALTSVQALATALASTMGTGSIAGVAAALCLGGPGAVFWMWVSALLGMMTSCGEKLLSVKWQRPAPGGGLQGGPMFYLRDALGCPVLARWFALACIPAALIGGNLVQSASISAAVSSAFGFSRPLIALVTALLAGLVLVGGIGRVAQVCQKLVPAMAALYLLGGSAVLLLRASAVPEAFRLIFTCALSPQAAAAGGAGWSLAAALRHGVARGVFTNEAGLGTSATAHGSAQVSHPARQGMWGIFEVCFATLVVCTMTALVILSAGVYQPQEMALLVARGELPSDALGAPLTLRSFSLVLGPAGNWIVSVSLTLFAFSSILGWSCYGQQGLRFLLGDDRMLGPYRALFLATALLGGFVPLAPLWPMVDLSSALLAIPNLIALILLAPQALACLRSWPGK